MAEKVTVMVLKVDLQCYKCCKKVKKVLCKFPQIRDQVYDEKSNTVRITVVCCSPEKIRDKLCCKGGGAIKSIEILQPPAKPKEPEKPKPAPAPAPEKPKEAEKPKPPQEKPKEAEKPKPAPPKEAEKPKPVLVKPKEAEKPKPAPEKPKEAEKPKAPPAADKPKEAEKPKAPPAAEKPKEKPPEPKPGPVPVPAFPPPQVFQACCEPCYHGHGWGAPPPPCYETFGRPVFDSWGGGGGAYRPCYNVNRCDYFCEENSQGCTVM
ncbi:pollen-specific leucine-rich repeat extensin-like protein 1 [Carica papaya]|uniref:pollen-specific leucine-rich repeat extensin-like protein 1 n=1 Tax=Carica papaya TaxID=3649 RepID=UPI000B8CB0F9|nr:pollen-specific leucine-rich repeat extensin-like protein 1 [Carica papaya]